MSGACFWALVFFSVMDLIGLICVFILLAALLQDVWDEYLRYWLDRKADKSKKSLTKRD